MITTSGGHRVFSVGQLELSVFRAIDGSWTAVALQHGHPLRLTCEGCLTMREALDATFPLAMAWHKKAVIGD